jgi:starch synthase
MVPLYLQTIYAWDRLFAETKTVLTIHNIGYQGVFSSDILPDLDLGDARERLHQDDLNDGRINFLKTGLLYADVLTTVSPTYAREIQGPDYGAGLDGILRTRADSLIGILNGVDYNEWDPATDRLIPHRYTPERMQGKTLCKKKLMKELGLSGDKDVPLMGIVSRLAGQKGFELVENVLPGLLKQRNFSLSVLGSGEHRFEAFFHQLQNAFPGRVSFYRGYNERLAHWIEAGSDMFLMPSLYEPCGLNQMYSLKYGTVPIVRETGGLADSVEQVNPATGSGTGIVFRDYNDHALTWAASTALELYEDKKLWRKIRRNGMAKDFTWDRQGQYYVELFRQLSDT